MDCAGLEPELRGSGFHHQQPLGVGERIRLGQVAQRVAGLRLDALRIGVGDSDPDLVGALGRAAQVLEVTVVERLKPAVDHPTATHCT